LGQVADACAASCRIAALFNHSALLRVRACGQQGGLDMALLPPLAAWADTVPPIPRQQSPKAVASQF